MSTYSKKEYTEACRLFLQARDFMCDSEALEHTCMDNPDLEIAVIEFINKFDEYRGEEL